MNGLNIRRILPLYGLFTWLTMAGCASSPQNANSGVQPSDVKFYPAAPPNARFIAKIPYSSGTYENWQQNCVNFLARKAAKLGGNAVVPGIELDYGADKVPAGDPRVSPVHPPTFIRTVNDQGKIVTMPGMFHFWSAVYFCPK